MRHTPAGIDAGYNKYLYNGKELQDKAFAGGVKFDWYDYGWRFYDPQIGRWTTPDPLTESYYRHSPYHFSGNNPIRFLDLNGMNYDDNKVDYFGNIILLQETNDNYDILYNNDENQSIQVEKGVLENVNEHNVLAINSETKEIIPASFSQMCTNGVGGGVLFEFLASNTSVEFSQVTNMKGDSYITTTHAVDYEVGVSHSLKNFVSKENPLVVVNHSHPSDGFVASGSDQNVARNALKNYPNASFNIFLPSSGVYIPFDGKSTYMPGVSVNKKGRTYIDPLPVNLKKPVIKPEPIKR